MLADLGLVQLAILLLGVLILFLASGVWIAISLGIVGFVAMLFTANVPIGNVLATTVWSASASWTLAALPLFIWMGEILFRTKLSEEMFRGLSPWLQWLPGRLHSLGTDGFGRSENREHLRAFFEISAEAIVQATLSALARDGKIDAKKAAAAVAEMGFDPERKDPART